MSAPPHALFERLPKRTSRIIFDTSAWPAEACLYGDDMKLTAATPPRGPTILTLAGPEGEVALDKVTWRHVVAAMKLDIGGAQ